MYSANTLRHANPTDGLMAFENGSKKSRALLVEASEEQAKSNTSISREYSDHSEHGDDLTDPRRAAAISTAATMLLRNESRWQPRADWFSIHRLASGISAGAPDIGIVQKGTFWPPAASTLSDAGVRNAGKTPEKRCKCFGL